MATNRPGPDAQISSRRAARLYRLVRALAAGPRRRRDLIRLGRAGMRTFYRDLNVLIDSGAEVRLTRRGYKLITPLKVALKLLPCPMPDLSFGDVVELSRGRGDAAAKLRATLRDLKG